MGTSEEGGVDSMFKNVVALFIDHGVQPQRLQVWTQKLLQRGGVIRQHINKTVTHIFATDVKYLEDRVGQGHVKKIRAVLLKYEWLEDCLKAGHLVAPDPYVHKSKTEYSGGSQPSSTSLDQDHERSQPSSLELPSSLDVTHMAEVRKRGELSEDEASYKHRKIDDDWMSVIHKKANAEALGRKGMNTRHGDGDSVIDSPSDLTTQEQSQTARSYAPPNLNKNITDIFGELRTLYGDALGDDRRSFSYHKANSVLEKLPFKITSMDQVKGLPGIGKSLKDKIGEILSTGTLAKLQHFKEDEKTRVISQFSSVWGIGPKKALELYAKGQRTLDDLVTDGSLTSAQRIGLKFHNDINTKIPRHEVEVMEALVRKVSESIEQDVVVVCGGSYRRGKAVVGDMDFIITHPDGKSHAGFLPKLIHKLKETEFLMEDLRYDSQVETGVGTYFGLCKYPGRELRHRIDLKVFPYEKYPYGLIAWTGNDVLNRRLRLLATSKGHSLDEQGCYPVSKDENGEIVINKSWSRPCRTEREVFDFLGYQWLEPHERNL